MAILTTIARALGTYTSTGVFTDTQTLVIGGKTYTTLTTLTDTDGYVNLGADAEATIDNLVAAINLSNEGESAVGPGTDYAASTTVHPLVYAEKGSATTLVVHAKVPGAIGNLIGTTETQTNGSWGAATLASGAGGVDVAINEIRQQEQLNASVLQAFDVIDAREGVEA